MFIPKTPAKDAEIGTVEEERIVRTWVVGRVPCRGGASRKVWKIQTICDGFVMVVQEDTPLVHEIQIPEEIKNAIESQRQMTQMLEKYEITKTVVVDGAILVTSGMGHLVGKANDCGLILGRWVNTMGVYLSDLMAEPEPEEFEMVSLV